MESEGGGKYYLQYSFAGMNNLHAKSLFRVIERFKSDKGLGNDISLPFFKKK